MQEYPWYEVVDGKDLQQGDIFRGFGIFVPSPKYPFDENNPSIEGDIEYMNVVVMTQSCDLEQGKARSVLLCPVFELWEFVDAAKKNGENHWEKTDHRDKLWQGNLPGYHLLDDFSHERINIGVSVVDFHEVHTAPTNQINDFLEQCGHRLRLRPPYKEHLAQAFARFFMRVGLPITIPKDKIQRQSSNPTSSTS